VSAYVSGEALAAGSAHVGAPIKKGAERVASYEKKKGTTKRTKNTKGSRSRQSISRDSRLLTGDSSTLVGCVATHLCLNAKSAAPRTTGGPGWRSLPGGR
jgi:hypothetical protein